MLWWLGLGLLFLVLWVFFLAPKRCPSCGLELEGSHLTGLDTERRRCNHCGWEGRLD